MLAKEKEQELVESFNIGRAEGHAEGRVQGIQGMLELCKSMNFTLEETIQKISASFKDDSPEFQDQLIRIWNETSIT